ncbi:heterokaryon incompatibility protein-domain-containing protein [Echria macrotheca]|uniref:Heterokaryon incompatibility protein-domain-containing protein n=1 Tax=Echria macrotheca TaxID=438768 RepID=A0AAJ0BN21_9PEZI|nr:heterokaryon incompatibility protein-domain-containing protein [Echria macrotheca]
MVEVEIYYTDETEHDTASRYPRLRLGHEVEARLTAREYAKKIEGWIAKCQATHVACRTESARLPRRVLDLSCDQIVLVDGQDKAAPYVALSHCWRTDRPCITNHANLGDRMRGINQNELTHVFQDAVQITRALGIRYLWIDALCIIQDSVQDWEQQSAVMADIYSGSYLNISATRSSSGHESFLDARWNLHDKIEDRPGWPLKHQVQSFPVVPGVSADGPRYPSSLKVRKPFRLSHQITDKRFSEASQAVAPLCQRAWVYQEKMLSPRTVHFHANEMVWECAEKGFCECGYLDMVTHLRIFKHFITNLSSLSRKDPLEPHSIWRMIVERYYKLSLTYEADRLPALAGLAARFAQHLPEHADHMYLAGLWRDTLAIDLLWYLKSPGTRLRLPHGPPSWSWASLRGSWLTFRWYPCISKHVGNVHRCDHRFSIISASVQGNQNSIYGAVSGGLIVVSGILCAISVHDEPRPWPHWLPPLAAQAPKNSFANLSLKFDDESDKAEVHGPNSTTCGFLFCLFVGTCHDDGPDGQTYSTVHDGLILRPFRTPNLTLFRRIGFWSQLNHGRDNYTEFFTERGETLTIRIV